MTGQFAETLEYASKNTLLNIFKLTAQGCIQAINAQAYLNEFLNVEHIANVQFENLKDRASEAKLSVAGLILSSQRQEVKENLCLQIKLGLDFIENFGKNLDKIEKKDSLEVQGYLIDRLKKYQEYAPLLNKYVESKYQVDIKLIDNLLEKLSPQQKLQEKKVSQFEKK